MLGCFWGSVGGGRARGRCRGGHVRSRVWGFALAAAACHSRGCVMGGTLTQRGGTVAWALVRRWLEYSFRGGCDPVAERGRDDTGLLAPHPAHPPQQTLCSCGCRRCRRRVSPGEAGRSGLSTG